jgi:hypothetical protein
MSRKREKINPEEIRHQFAINHYEIKTLKERVEKSHHDIETLKDTVDKLHRNRKQLVLTIMLNLITIGAIISGAYFQVWLNRPVVGYQLYDPTSVYYAGTDSYSLPSQLFMLRAENTGQTDIIVEFTIAATNCTVSKNANGPFEPNATTVILLQGRSTWVENGFYFRAYSNVTSFKLHVSLNMKTNRDFLTRVIDTQVTYYSVNTLDLVWVKSSTQYSRNAYELQS